MEVLVLVETSTGMCMKVAVCVYCCVSVPSKGKDCKKGQVTLMASVFQLMGKDEDFN